MLVFLDFDGVICNSVLECYVASWKTYYGDVVGRLPNVCALTEREQFYRYRPLMRTGEDYVLLQQLIHEGVALHSQSDFDRQLERVGAETMRSYRELIYRVRARMLVDDRAGWLRLNRVYPHVAAVLDRPASDDRFFILSTKKAQYISEILQDRGIEWPTQRIITAEGRTKVSIIGEVLQRHRQTEAVFVEDQPDHFPGGSDSLGFKLSCYLAEWGYVQDEWLEPGRFVTIDSDGFAGLIDGLLDSSR